MTLIFISPKSKAAYPEHWEERGGCGQGEGGQSRGEETLWISTSLIPVPSPQDGGQQHHLPSHTALSCAPVPPLPCFPLTSLQEESHSRYPSRQAPGRAEPEPVLSASLTLNNSLRMRGTILNLPDATSTPSLQGFLGIILGSRCTGGFSPFPLQGKQ